MAVFVLTSASTFPDGTSVGVYPAGAFPFGGSGPPEAAPIEEQTMVEGRATFTSLSFNTSYWAAALVSGEWRRVGMLMEPSPTGGGSSLVFSVAGRVGDVVLTKTDVGLTNVDNTTDLNKPISTATQAALDSLDTQLDAKQPLDADLTAIATTGLTSTLASSTSVGATTLTVDRTISPFASGTTYVAIDANTVNCEIRRATTIAGDTVSSLSALGRAHSAGARVLFFQEASVPAWWFGAKGDAATDDNAALQQALIETNGEALWLDGGSQARIYMTSLPLVALASLRLRALTIRPTSQFPAEATNAVLVQGQGTNPNTFTVDTTTNVITASGGASTALGTMFFGPNLPAPLVAGRTYYATVITSTTFTVSETFGGATVDITTAGGAGNTCYRGLFATGKMHMDQVTIEAVGRGVTADASTDTFTTNDAASHRLVTGQPVYISGTEPAPLDDRVTYYAISTGTSTFQLAASEADALASTEIDITTAGSSVQMWNGNQNGMFAKLQQPSRVANLRIEDCRGIGLCRAGQQAVYVNLMVIDCGVGVVEDQSKFNWNFGFDVEGCYDSLVKIATGDAGSYPAPTRAGGGAQNNAHYGCHFEKNGLINGDALFDFLGNIFNITYDNVRVTSGGNPVFRSNPETAGSNAYTVRDMTVSGTAGSTVIFNDTGDGYTYTYTLQNTTEYIEEHSTRRRPDTSSVVDTGRNVRLGFNGRFIKESLGTNISPTREFQPASNQTVAQHQWRARDTTIASKVNRDGYFVTMRHAAPAAGDMAAGEMAIWFDQTDGASALKVYAKQADGTVKTATVALS